MSLPLVYFRRVNTCPLPVNRITFQLLYGLAVTDSQRQQLADWYQEARLAAGKLQQLRDKARESNAQDPLRPWSVFTSPTIRFGVVIHEPSIVTNPEIYEWKGRAPFLKLPWYLKVLSDASFASAAYNAFQMLEVEVTRYCVKKGWNGHYDLALLWMLFSRRDAGIPQDVADRRALISALGDNLLPVYLASGGWDAFDAVLAAVLSGIKFIEESRRKALATPAETEETDGLKADV